MRSCRAVTRMVRFKLTERPTWNWYAETGPGVSWSDLTTPVRGTKFNYLFQAGTGVMRRVGPNSHVARRLQVFSLVEQRARGKGSQSRFGNDGAVCRVVVFVLRTSMKVTILTLSLLLVIPASFAERASPGALKGVPQFTADPKWPVLPDGFTWGQVIGIFADSKGHVWTSSRGRISEWDPQGKLVQSWDARGPDGKWNTIHGLFVDHNGFVWTNARESNLTVKFTRTGQVALVIGKFDQTGGSNDTTLMGRPSEIWVDPADNEVFVADGYGNRRIIVFDGATGKVPAPLGRVREAAGGSAAARCCGCAQVRHRCQ